MWLQTLRASITILFISALQANAATAVLWEATSGLLPDASSPAWTLGDAAVPEDPILGPSFLTLETSENAEAMYYLQNEPTFEISYPLIIEVRMRVVSGSTSHTARGYASVNFTLTPNYGNALQIRDDEIFLSVGNLAKGTSAFVDTNDAFHTYKITIDAAGDITVDYDGVPTLTGSAFTSGPHNGATPRVLWGMASNLSFGKAEWESVLHDVEPSQVPAMNGLAHTFLAATLMLIACARIVRRTKG